MNTEDKDDITSYYKRLANPVCTLSRTQKGMIGNYNKVVTRQAQSRQAAPYTGRETEPCQIPLRGSIRLF
jgi:hypothetical protein